MKLNRKLLSIVRTVAPGLATAFGGPLAGMAAQVVSNTLLGKPDGSPGEIETALLGASPETLEKLKAAEADFKVQMRKLNVDLEAIRQRDRASARAREIALKDWAPGILATVVIVGFFATVGYVLSGQLELDGRAGVLIGTIVGYVSAKADQVIAYYFGSSKGSVEKTKALSDMARR